MFYVISISSVAIVLSSQAFKESIEHCVNFISTSPLLLQRRKCSVFIAIIMPRRLDKGKKAA